MDIFRTSKYPPILFARTRVSTAKRTSCSASQEEDTHPYSASRTALICVIICVTIRGSFPVITTRKQLFYTYMTLRWIIFWKRCLSEKTRALITGTIYYSLNRISNHGAQRLGVGSVSERRLRGVNEETPYRPSMHPITHHLW